jgi:hypothetical protein
MKRTAFALLICLGALSSAAAARAETPAGCKGSAWPLDVELGLLAAGGEAVRSGMVYTAPPAKAMKVALQPAASVELPVTPTGKPKSVPEKPFAGTIGFHGVPTPGLYQVSLSNAGWIDVVQNGDALKSVAHTGMKDCPALHKSVRFEIGPGPFALQLSNMPDASVGVVLRAATAP